MSWTPNDSAIKVDADLNEKIANASPEEIKEILKNSAVGQGLVERDYYDNSILLPVEQRANAALPKKFAVTVELPDGKRIVEADTEADAQRLAVEAYRQAAAQHQQQTQTPQPQSRDEQGRFTSSELDPAVRVETELKFKRGEISVEDYLEQTGAVDSYLSKKGISVDALRNTVDQAQSQQFTQSWENATQEFLSSPSGADWPGGQDNLQRIGEKMIELGLVEAQDKVAALAQAYVALKSEGRIVPNAAREAEREFAERVSNANSHEAIRRAASGLFGS
jgi:hypothetical protein